MGSTNKTENLQLNQWTRSDPVNVDDFNADNAKLDEAVAEAKQIADTAVSENRIVKLFDVTIQVATYSIEFNLSDIDLSKFLEIQVYRIPNYENSTINLDGSLYLRVNKVANYYSSGDGVSWSDETYALCSLAGNVCNIVLHGHWLNFQGVLAAYRILRTRIGTSLNTIDMLRSAYSSDRFPVGTRFIIMGVKA